MSRFFIIICLFCMIQPLALQAGALDDFEKGTQRSYQAPEPSHPPSPDRTYGPFEDDEDLDAGGCLGASLLVGVGLFYGTRYSWERVTKKEDPQPPASSDSEKKPPKPVKKTEAPSWKNATPRKHGEAVLPYIKYSPSYFRMDDSLSAVDHFVEVGFGPIGLEGRYTVFDETDPEDRMELVELIALLRLSFDDRFTVGIGVGQMSIYGNIESSGLCFAIPVTWAPTEWATCSFRYVSGRINDNDLSDVDVRIGLGHRFVQGHVGYRFLNSPASSITGPFAGVSFSF